MLRVPRSTFNVERSTFYILRYTFNAERSTFSPVAGNRLLRLPERAVIGVERMMEDPPEEGIGVGPGMNTHRAITADRPQRLREQTDPWLGHVILPSMRVARPPAR
jgi:hypothetical protein